MHSCSMSRATTAFFHEHSLGMGRVPCSVLGSWAASWLYPRSAAGRQAWTSTPPTTAAAAAAMHARSALRPLPPPPMSQLEALWLQFTNPRELNVRPPG